jgi:hypothetical protein
MLTRVPAVLRRSFVLALYSFAAGVLLLPAIPAMAADWQKPTQEELTMTSQPEVPGADAVILFR